MKTILVIIFTATILFFSTDIFAKSNKNYSSTTRQGNVVSKSNTSVSTGKNSATSTTRTNTYNQGKQVGSSVSKSNTSVSGGANSKTYTTKTNTYEKGKQVGTSTSRVTVKKK